MPRVPDYISREVRENPSAHLDPEISVNSNIPGQSRFLSAGDGNLAARFDSIAPDTMRAAIVPPIRSEVSFAQIEAIDVHNVKSTIQQVSNFQSVSISSRVERIRTGLSQKLQSILSIDGEILPRVHFSNVPEKEELKWEDLYCINLKPRKFLVKLRQNMGRFRIGLNSEFFRSPNLESISSRGGIPRSILGFDTENPKLKAVLKPNVSDPKWKVEFEPKRQDLRLISKKINIGRFFHFQVGVGHEFINYTSGLTWKVSTVMAASDAKKRKVYLQEKTKVPIIPGFDLRAGWRAEYILPEVKGSLGTEEPGIVVNPGKINASLDRIETIFTFTW